MMLVRAGAEVVVREHGAQGVVLALVIDDRVGPPQLRRPLRAAKRVLRAKRVLVVRLALSRSARRAQPLVQQRLMTGVPTRAGGMNVAGTRPSTPGYLAWLTGKGFNLGIASDFAIDIVDDGVGNAFN